MVTHLDPVIKNLSEMSEYRKKNGIEAASKKTNPTVTYIRDQLCPTLLNDEADLQKLRYEHLLK